MSIAAFVATVGAGLFAGASTYVSVAEHPAWLESGPAISIKGLGPGFRRAAALQGGLATVSMMSAAVAWFQGSGICWLAGGLMLGALVPFTLLIIMPTNRRLLDPALDPASREAVDLLLRWGRLHAVRTLVGVAVFLCFVCTLVWP